VTSKPVPEGKGIIEVPDIRGPETLAHAGVVVPELVVDKKYGREVPVIVKAYPVTELASEYKAVVSEKIQV
jgi:hypothetical protein